MKQAFLTLLIMTSFAIGVNAQTKKDGTPDMRYSSNKQTYSTPSYSKYTPSYSTPSSKNLRPVYSGPAHTTYHGGSYPGSTNSHHKNGTYVNPISNNRYGIHKKGG